MPPLAGRTGKGSAAEVAMSVAAFPTGRLKVRTLQKQLPGGSERRLARAHELGGRGSQLPHAAPALRARRGAGGRASPTRGWRAPESLARLLATSWRGCVVKALGWPSLLCDDIRSRSGRRRRGGVRGVRARPAMPPRVAFAIVGRQAGSITALSEVLRAVAGQSALFLAELDARSGHPR